MTDESAIEETLSPDEAFGVLGNETRFQILQVLGSVDDPLSFSALRERVGMTDSGQFNYHLDRLTGHFVRRGEDGYELRRAGERVVEAVLSGAVTDAPVLERTVIDYPCHFCDAPVAVTFREERVEVYCTECPGTYSRASFSDEPVSASENGSADGGASEGKPSDQSDGADDARYGYLGYHPLPPAGVAGRSPAAVHRAAWTWGQLELIAAASGVCPRCSAALDRDKRVCTDHDDGNGLCDACGRRYAVSIGFDCSNCIYRESGAAVVGLAQATPLLEFLAACGLNPFAPSAETFPTVSRVYNNFEEEVCSTQPFEARFTFTVDGDSLALTVDDDLQVIGVDRD